MSSAWENFFAATVVLASAGPIKHRLAEAYREHLADLEEDELPREIRDEFSSLSSAMSCVRPMKGENAIQATVRKMSDLEAGGFAWRSISTSCTLAKVREVDKSELP